jgi:hypothetical protein
MALLYHACASYGGSIVVQPLDDVSFSSSSFHHCLLNITAYSHNTHIWTLFFAHNLIKHTRQRMNAHGRVHEYCDKHWWISLIRAKWKI